MYFPNLQELYMSHNHFTKINWVENQHYLNLYNILLLDLSENDFHINFPLNCQIELPQLRYFYLHGNKFHGNICKEFDKIQTKTYLCCQILTQGFI